MKMFHEGQKVKFNGQSSIINDRDYAGCVGVVDFQGRETLGVPGLGYVLIKCGKQRKPRLIGFHQDSLELVD